MTAEKKSSDFTSRLNVKSSKRLLSKTSKAAPSTISSPPKAAIALSSTKKEDVQRRRNPVNDTLRRRSGEYKSDEKDGPTPLQESELGSARSLSEDGATLDTQMVDRVAELESALKVAKEEQEALREELDKARQLRQRDHDTTEKVQQHQLNLVAGDASHAPHDATNGDMHDGDGIDTMSEPESSLRISEGRNDYVPPEQSNADVLRQNLELRYKLAQLQDRMVSQDITYRSTLDRALGSHGDAEWNELRLRLHATEKESQERLQQLLSLKSSISSLTRSDSQVTDTELTDSFTQLSNRIREWVISNFRRTKFEAGDLPPDTVKALRSLTPAYESIRKTDRLALYQALVASALMQVFEEPICVALPHMGPLSTIRSFAESIQGHMAEYRAWVRATIRVIEKGETGIQLEQSKSDLLHRIAGEIVHLLFTLTSVSLTPVALSALTSILKAAADLQRTLALQKARYQVLFFHHQHSSGNIGFDDRRMEPTNDLDGMDEDNNVQPEHAFNFCIFPCLEKFGNEWGENVEVGNVLLKAQVHCGVA